MSFKRHPLMRFVRDEPLEHCPDPVCRRSGLCHAKNPEWECRKHVREINEWRDYMAAKIMRLHEEWCRNNPEAAARPRHPYSDERWATEGLPLVRAAITQFKAERARQAGREALLRQDAEVSPEPHINARPSSSRPRPRPAAH